MPSKPSYEFTRLPYDLRKVCDLCFRFTTDVYTTMDGLTVCEPCIDIETFD